MMRGGVRWIRWWSGGEMVCGGDRWSVGKGGGCGDEIVSWGGLVKDRKGIRVAGWGRVWEEGWGRLVMGMIVADIIDHVVDGFSALCVGVRDASGDFLGATRARVVVINFAPAVLHSIFSNDTVVSPFFLFTDGRRGWSYAWESTGGVRSVRIGVKVR